MKKVFLFLVVLIGFGIAAIAQDVIITKDGTKINSKVTEVNENDIRYKLFDKPQHQPHSQKWLRHIWLRADTLAPEKDSEFVRNIGKFGKQHLNRKKINNWLALTYNGRFRASGLYLAWTIPSEYKVLYFRGQVLWKPLPCQYAGTLCEYSRVRSVEKNKSPEGE